MSLDPIVHTIEVKPAPARAFDLFVSQMGRWWPGPSAGKTPRADIVLEPRAGGRWYEHDAAGTQTNWGKVLEWQPPERVLLAWQLNCEFGYDPDLVTEVELTFSSSQSGGTLVRFEHRTLERFGPEAERHAEKLRGGWPVRLDGFGAYADSQACTPSPSAAAAAETAFVAAPMIN